VALVTIIHKMRSLPQPLAVGLMLMCAAALAAAASPKVVSSLINAQKSKHPFSSPHGLFIQVQPSAYVISMYQWHCASSQSLIMFDSSYM
jgi:hypothetical protein